ncbi:MAG: DUF1631 family protein [Halothiobacillaceae bacterium]
MSQNKPVIDPQSLKASLRSLARKRLTERINALFGTIDDTLFSMADRSLEAKEQNLYFDAMRALRLERGAILYRFFKHLEEYGNDKPVPRPVAPEAEETDDEISLALIDQEEMEERVAVTNMVANVSEATAQEVAALETRLEWLDEHNPGVIDPEAYSLRVLASAFREAVHESELDLRINLLILKQFEQHVFAGLAEIFQEMNDVLIEAGILPKIRSRRRGLSNPGGGVGQGDASAPAPGPAGNAPGAAAGYPGSIAHEGTGAAATGPAGNAPGAAAGYPGSIAHEGTGAAATGPAGNAPGAAAGYPGTPGPAWLNELVQAGAPLHQQGVIVPPTAAWSPQTLRRFIMQEWLGSVREDGSGIAGREREVIELVSILFSSILEDSQMQEPARTLIARLQWPILKTALDDETFFQRASHPARDLLNVCTRLGAQPIPESTPAHRDLLATIDEVLARFQSEPEVFREATERVEKVLTEEVPALETDDRDNTRQRRKELVARAREHIKALMIERIAGRAIDPVIQKFLQTAWGPLMVVILLNQGRHSDQWQHATAMLDRIIELCFTPAPRRNEVDELIEELYDDLESVNFDTDRVAALISPLRDWLLSQVESSTGSFRELTLPEDDATTPVPEEHEVPEGLDSLAPFDLEAPEALAGFEEAGEQPQVPEPPDQTQDKSGGIDPEVLGFLNAHVFNGEWFQVFNGEGLALRRLKGHSLNEEMRVVYFANRNEEKVLFRPLSAFFEDVLAQRSRPVFDSAVYGKALERLGAEIASGKVTPP